jgi:hypothetical protein
VRLRMLVNFMRKEKVEVGQDHKEDFIGVQYCIVLIRYV